MGKGPLPPRVLVTAFEPFGLPGRPGRGENASESVVRAWEERARGRHPVVVLPVDPRCEVALARALDTAPEGIVALGEADLPGAWDTNVEARARDLPIRLSTEAPHAAAGRTPVLASPFASTLPLLAGMEREDRIGSFWCNRAYYRVLQWCGIFQRPAVFLHLRVGGDRGRQVDHLSHVVAHMERSLGRGVGAGASLAEGARPWRPGPGESRA